MIKTNNIRPGTLVYCIEKNEDDFSGYLFMAGCLDYVIACSEYVGYKGFLRGQLEKMCHESYEWEGVDVHIFPISKVFLTEDEAMKHMHQNKIVESLCQVDFSKLAFPLVTIYEKPLDFPDAFVARVWDAKGPKPTNVMIKRDTLQEVREDIVAAGFKVKFTQAEGDDPHIVETWM